MEQDVDKAHVKKYRDSISQATTPLELQNWFCKTSSIEESRIRGYWDFACHILTPSVISEISNPQDKTVLEIGYGGGRILNAASSFFGHAIGVDIHSERPMERDNVTLLTGNGRTLPVESGIVDLVYSFIVFMHLQSFDAFVSYLQETHRVLRVGGIAQLYYGLKKKEGHAYHEAPANHASLIIGEQTAMQESVKAGFEIIDTGRSYKKMPYGFPNVIGQQAYLTLKKI